MSRKLITVILRASNQSDMPFLRQVLYDAVFWRASANKLSFEEGLALPDVSKSLADFGKREGDSCVVATVDSVSAGAAWYRYWTDDDSIRGYIEKTIPVLVIAVHSDYRHQGIGGKMIQWLVNHASKQAISKISLSVSKDNYAIHLYRQQGFLEHRDTGDSFLMIREI